MSRAEGEEESRAMLTARENGSGMTIHIAQQMRPIGGLETLILDLLSHEPQTTFCVSLEGSPSELGQEATLAPFAGRVLGMSKRPGLDWSLVGRLARVLRRLRPQSVVAHHIGPLIYGGLASRLARVPTLLYYEHDTWHYRNGNDRLIARVCSNLLKPCCAAVSASAADEMRQIFSNSEIRVVPPGVDLKRFTIRSRTQARARLGLEATGVLLGSVGRLAEVKGHKHLLDAFARLPTDYRLALLGSGPEQSRLVAQALELGIAERVRFLGHSGSVEEIIPAFDLLCLPSLAEGLPRAVLEALACGVPVVASNVGGVASVVGPAAGETVPAGDPVALGDAIERVLRRRALPGAIRGSIADCYSLEAVALALHELGQVNRANGERGVLTP